MSCMLNFVCSDRLPRLVRLFAWQELLFTVSTYDDLDIRCVTAITVTVQQMVTPEWL